MNRIPRSLIAKIVAILAIGITLAGVICIVLVWLIWVGPSAPSLARISASYGITFPEGTRLLGSTKTAFFRPEIWAKFSFPKEQFAEFESRLPFRLGHEKEEQGRIIAHLRMVTYWGSSASWWEPSISGHTLVGSGVEPKEDDNADISRYSYILVDLNDSETVIVYLYCIEDT